MQRYRLAIREPVADFELIAMTEKTIRDGRTGFSTTPLLRQGGKYGIRIVVPRQDSFEGDIVITAENLPAGVTAKPLTLSGTVDSGILIVSAAKDAPTSHQDIRIIGRAKVDGQEIVREARFSALVWGFIFADSIRVRTRLIQRVPLGVNGSEQAPVAIEPLEDKTWTVEVGQKLEIPLKTIDNGTRKGTLTVAPFALYGLIRGAPTVNVAENAEGKLTINFAPNGNFNVKPGTYQFALHGTGIANYQKNVPLKERYEANKKHIAKLQAKYQKADADAKAAVKTAQEELDQAKKNLTTATADAKPTAQSTVQEKTTKLNEAKTKAQQAASKLAEANKAVTTIDNRIKSVSSPAKSTKFVAWSDLITVQVIEKKK